MYTEQAWVEQLLKRVRNEADTATNSFHGYLVDQLLTVTTKVLAALQTQDASVKELSSKQDKNFAGINEGLEKYMDDQTKLRNERSHAEAEYYAGIMRRNEALETRLKVLIEANEEAAKVSCILPSKA